MSAKRFNFIAQQRKNCNRGERESGKWEMVTESSTPLGMFVTQLTVKRQKNTLPKKRTHCHSQDVTQDVPSAIVRLARYRFACVANSNFISNSLTCVDYCLLIFNLFLIFCALLTCLSSRLPVSSCHPSHLPVCFGNFFCGLLTSALRTSRAAQVDYQSVIHHFDGLLQPHSDPSPLLLFTCLAHSPVKKSHASSPIASCN